MARIIIGKEIIDADPGISVESAVRSAGLFPDSYIFLKDGRPVPMTTILENDDEIEGIRIASGG